MLYDETVLYVKGSSCYMLTGMFFHEHFCYFAFSGGHSHQFSVKKIIIPTLRNVPKREGKSEGRSFLLVQYVF